MVLSFQGVTKTYNSSHLGKVTSSRGIENLTLEIAKGEAFGLLGLNGSGKTTTFKLSLGLIRPTSGTIRVLGKEPSDAEAHRRIGFLPELPYLYTFLTPEESLRFYGRLSGLTDKELPELISKALEQVGLTASAKRRIAGFSRGMIQRVGLAQAILHDPEFLILDEPASGLDPLAIKRFRELLFTLNSQAKALLVSSHSISEIEKLCHRVGILKEGRLVRVLKQSEWAQGLEKLFVETVE